VTPEKEKEKDKKKEKEGVGLSRFRTASVSRKKRDSSVEDGGKEAGKRHFWRSEKVEEKEKEKEQRKGFGFLQKKSSKEMDGSREKD